MQSLVTASNQVHRGARFGSWTGASGQREVTVDQTWSEAVNAVVWKSFEVGPTEGEWEPAKYNVKWTDGQEYGRWRRVLRKDSHGLTVISRYRAPPGK